MFGQGLMSNGRYRKREMKNFDEYIWSFGQLARPQQEEIERYVAAHTEYIQVFEDVKSMYRMLEEVNAFTDEVPGDSALAYYIAHQYLQHHPLPDGLRTSFENMKRRIDRNPEIRLRFEEIRFRMDRIASHSDPLMQFEALTGHTLSPQSSPGSPPASGMFAGDREPTHPLSRGRSRGLRILGASLSLIVAATVFLFAANRIDRLAYTDPALLVLDGYEPVARSEYRLPATAGIDEQFIYGQAALRDAQRAWLGIYYRYNQDRLDEAQDLFERVRRSGQETALLWHEATYYLAKIAIANEDLESARRLLNELTTNTGPRTVEAGSLLKRLAEW
jgi:hypothetical protein